MAAQVQNGTRKSDEKDIIVRGTITCNSLMYGQIYLLKGTYYTTVHVTLDFMLHFSRLRAGS